MASTKTVVSIFDHHAVSIAGMETYARELSVQLAQFGWRSVLVFASGASEEVQRFLALPNTELCVLEGCGRLAWRPILNLARLLRVYRPKIVHLHFIAPRSGYPWLAKLLGVDNVFMHDHISRLCPICDVDSQTRGPLGGKSGPGREADPCRVEVATQTRQGAVPAKGDGAISQDECDGRSPRWRRAINTLLCLPVTKMFCVSSFIYKSVVAYGALPERRIETLYNGVDLGRAESGAWRRAEFRRSHTIPDDRVLVVQAGLLRREKGLPDLLHAAQRLLHDGAAVHFLVAGEGPQRQEYEQLSQQLGISPRVTFTGRVCDPLGGGLWAACDIACQVSRWREAFGLTIAEAMASGKPVIGTRIGAIPELIEDGSSGFLVEPGDTAGLAGKIALLARDPRQRQDMGQTGKRICREKFNLQKNVACLIGRYGIILDR